MIPLRSRSPRLPNELLELIVGHIEDSNTMRQCCLAGSCLLPSARRALFTEVRLFTGAAASSNLEKMLECYSQKPYAQYARCLVIQLRGSPPFVPAHVSAHGDTQLLQLITLLSTCQPTVDPPTTPTFPLISKISSLYIFGMIGSSLDFARILRAFPRLTKLKCDLPIVWASPFNSLDIFLSKAPPPPPLERLELGRSHFLELDSHVLFPTGTNVCLRSLTINHRVNAPLWNNILQRAGDTLEEISVRGPRSGPKYRMYLALSFR